MTPEMAMVLTEMQKDTHRTEQELRRQREREELRDQFAAAALTGLLASPDRGWIAEADLAKSAYACADAMMHRRAQPTADAPAPAPTAP